MKTESLSVSPPQDQKSVIDAAGRKFRRHSRSGKKVITTSFRGRIMRGTPTVKMFDWETATQNSENMIYFLATSNEGTDGA